ncbi:MAG TPA: hypothetical protein VFA39_10645 [Steroidobacteraceae bacterium]|nr:hypothetical protein [Steroidobacteraceae bacterium]
MWYAHLGERDVAVLFVRQTQDIGGEGGELPDHLRRARRWQEADLACENARGKTYRKLISVRAYIDNVLA